MPDLERERIEEALRNSEQQYRELLENINEVIYKVDRQGVITYISAAVESLSGYRPDELVGHSFSTFIYPPDLPGLMVSFNKTLAGQLEPFEYRVLTKTGGTHWVRSFSRLLVKNQEIIGVQGLLTDISDLKRAEEELRQTEAKYRSIFENAMEGIFQTTPEGRFLTANPALAKMLGYDSPSDLMANLTDLDHQLYVDPKRRAEFKRILQDQDAVGEFESQVYRSDGQVIWVSENARGVRDNKGNLLYYEGTSQDITQRKHLEEQIRQMHKMEAVGQLAGGIAHEFNNLLTVITGYSQLIGGRLKEDNSLRKELAEIQKAAARAASLVRQLLAFSQRQMLMPKLLNLNDIVVNMEDMLRGLLGENITLEIRLDKALGLVKADPGQIEQVILNLAGNARDAMPQGGSLVIETHNYQLDRSPKEVPPGIYVMLSMTDTGCGIPDEIQDRIFDPFFSTKEVGRGTGLGLASVHGIVYQSGGHIRLESSLNQGTSFRIYLPCVEQADTASLQKERAIVNLPQGWETILVVEDEDMVRALTVNMLKRQGYRVLSARNGEEGKRLAITFPEPLHLILADVIMPVMNGPEFITQVQAVRQDFKVIYMSGHPDDIVDYHGILEQDIPLIQKPFVFETLITRVRQVLDQ